MLPVRSYQRDLHENAQIAGQVAASKKSHMLSSDLRRQEAFYSQFSKVNMFEAMF